MRRMEFFLIPAALVFLAALPTLGQHGAGHGGGGFSSAPSGARSGAPAGGGFHAPSFSGSYAAGSRAFAPAPSSFSRESAAANLRGLNFDGQSASASHHGPEHRRPYNGYGGRGYVPLYGYGAYLVPNFVGYPFGFDSGDFDDDTSASQQPASPQEQEEPPAGEYAQPPQGEIAEEQPPVEYRPPYQGAIQGSISEQPVQPQPATTLIFNDGRPNEQVHNYILSGTTLYDLDGGTQREIPLSEINVPATTAANRSAGVDFAPPTS
jgi:hypothetical protein